jgi:hypothetical protein
MLTRWREHEERVRQSSLLRGWRVFAQKKSRSTGLRPDFLAVDGRSRHIHEAKWCKNATKAHIDQARRYRGFPFFAQESAIHYPHNANIPDSVRQYARENRVRLIRTRVDKLKERRSGIFAIFQRRHYAR